MALWVPIRNAFRRVVPFRVSNTAAVIDDDIIQWRTQYAVLDGMLPMNLKGQRVLKVGGDHNLNFLLRDELGAKVTAVETHQRTHRVNRFGEIESRYLHIAEDFEFMFDPVFDFAVSYDAPAFQQQRNYARWVGGMNRALKKGGSLLVRQPVGGSYETLRCAIEDVATEFGLNADQADTLYLPTSEEFISSLREFGFKVHKLKSERSSVVLPGEMDAIYLWVSENAAHLRPLLPANQWPAFLTAVQGRVMDVMCDAWRNWRAEYDTAIVLAEKTNEVQPGLGVPQEAPGIGTIGAVLIESGLATRAIEKQPHA